MELSSSTALLPKPANAKKRFVRVACCAAAMAAITVVALVINVLVAGAPTRPTTDVLSAFRLMAEHESSIEPICPPEFPQTNVYCKGDIVLAVNTLDIYNDSKDFIDSSLKAEPDEVIKKFSHVNASNRDDVKRFIDAYFHPPGLEMHPANPTDWVPKPTPLDGIRDSEYRVWALGLHEKWKSLCRKISTHVRDEPNRTTLLFVPHEFVVPGGRFREYYYWDTYWTIRGLLQSQMFDTALKMLRNFAYLVEKYGFVPNGGRLYYLRRSQPPLFSAMVDEFVTATKNFSVVDELFDVLDKEFMFWEQNRSVVVSLPGAKTSYTLYHYDSPTNEPRPVSIESRDIEMLGRDLAAAAGLSSDAKRSLYKSIASAAESGWDFSSRWFVGGDSINKTLTAEIIPVDLNAFMCGNARILAKFAEMLKKKDKQRYYANKHALLVRAIEDVFWNATLGAWFDYWPHIGLHNAKPYLSSVAPMWCSCFPSGSHAAKAEALYSYINASGLLSYPYGIPTSLKDSGEQWDFPNAWPPLVFMTVEAFRLSGVTQIIAAADRLAKAWLERCFFVYNATLEEGGDMFEKYNVVNKSERGSGGEYNVQAGFTWTNGVVLDWLVRYFNPDAHWARTTSAGVSFSRSLPSCLLVICSIIVILRCAFAATPS